MQDGKSRASQPNLLKKKKMLQPKQGPFPKKENNFYVAKDIH